MSGTASSAGERVLRTDHAGSRLGGCPPRLVGLLAFLLAGALIGGLIWRQEQQRLREARSQAASVAAERAHDIRTSVEGALAPTYALAAMLQPGRQGIPAFAAACDRLLRHFPSVSALQLAPGGVVRQVVPLAGNESLIGVDLLHDPDLGTTRISAGRRDTAATVACRCSPDPSGWRVVGSRLSGCCRPSPTT